EIRLVTGKPILAQRTAWAVAASLREARRGEPMTRDEVSQNGAATDGVFVFRERAELYERINRRVEKMFAEGVVDEVRSLRNSGTTAERTLGLREIRALLAGGIPEPECIAKIQQATRRYAKRQLTWFQRQTNFAPLNLSAHRSSEPVEFISQSASRVFARG